MTPPPFARPMLITAIGVLSTGAVAILYLPAAQDSTTKPEPKTPMPNSDPIENANRSKIFSTSGYDVTPLAKEEISLLAEDLTPEQFQITQKAGTEPAFCGTLLDNKKEGMYVCVVCGLPLFKSDHKFNSGTGWPSFFQPFDSSHVGEESDVSLGMARTEIRCNRCASHLGHVFPDGPPPSNQRYCLNGASLDFIEDGADVPAASKPALETAYFAGGCFWGIEHAFQQIPGVVDATSGYQQGASTNPSYKEVCTKTSGHAESVRVLFDPTQVDFETLVKFFFIVHDPTQLNRQGPDLGSQYRSGIYTTTDAQAMAAKKVLAAEQASTYKDQTIVTEIEAAKTFWPAEAYHQNYVFNTGRACHVNIPAALEAIGIDPAKKPTS